MRARLSLILLAALSGLILTGCGAGEVIDDEKTQIAVKYDVEEATGTKVESVTCPAEVPASTGTRFTCRVEAVSGDLATVELEVSSQHGDLKVLRLTAE